MSMADATNAPNTDDSATMAEAPPSREQPTIGRTRLLLFVVVGLVAIGLGSMQNLNEFMSVSLPTFEDHAVVSGEVSNNDDQVMDGIDAEEEQTQRRIKEDGLSSSLRNDSTNDSGDSTGSRSTSMEEPLNVVLLYADDWRHDSIGSENPLVYTPFLDKLAAKGVKFTHSCVTTSVCWISRANMYTGQYTSRHKSTKMRTPYWYKNWNNTMPALLKEQGNYYMGHMGKWHWANYEEVRHTWDFSHVYYGTHWMRTRPQPNSTARRRPIHVTQQNEVDAIEFLRERPTNQPFFLSVCFFAPHCVDGNKDQYFPQDWSKEYYNDTDIPVPASGTDEAWERMPSFFGPSNEGRRRWRNRFETPTLGQEMMKKYYRLITEVDKTCEVIYNELEKQDLLKNTLVIFTTDNGMFHSEHGLAGKWYPHQESIRVPLIVSDPRMDPSKAGTTNDDFVLSIDLAPTILSAAKIQPHHSMQGRDLSSLYLDESVDDWRKEFFYEHPTHNSKHIIPASTALVRKDYKYVRWPDFELEQLFNLKTDPLELDDLLGQEGEHRPMENRTVLTKESVPGATLRYDPELLESMRKRYHELAEAAK